MNFALPAITLLLLLLPGILAVQGFLGKIGRKTSDPVGQAGITWAWLVALLIAPIIHLALSATLVALHLAIPPDLHAIFVLLSGQFEDKADFSRTIDSVISTPWYVTVYFLVAALVGLVLGRLVVVADRLPALLGYGPVAALTQAATSSACGSTAGPSLGCHSR